MIRFPKLLALIGLLLVSCDKPTMSDTRKNGIEEPSASPDFKHSERMPEPDPVAEAQARFNEVEKLSTAEAREKAYAEIAWNTIEADSETAHKAFGKLPEGSPERIRLIRHYAMRLAEQNPEEAMEWATSLPNELERSAALSQIALEIAEKDPMRAANLISESGVAGRDLDVAVVQVIQRWAAQSPSDAASWVGRFPNGDARQAGMQEIATRWLPQDPVAAFRWFGELKDPSLREDAARAWQGVLLQQTQQIREEWLRHASPEQRAELESQRANALKDMGNNIPQPQE